MLTPEEAERHPQRSAITRALGTEETVEVDGFTVVAEPGDVYLICSDGLSNMLTDDEMAAAIENAGGDPHDAADALVRAANDARRGGQHHRRPLRDARCRGDRRADAPAAPEPDDAAGPGHAGVPRRRARAGGATDARRRPTVSTRRFGAGPGGRVAALLLVAAILGIGVLALYLFLSR